MNRLYFCRAEDIYARLDGIIEGVTGGKRDILHTQSGKPYLEGNPVYFSVSHSGNKGAIALSDKPVGVDLEIFKKREHKTVINRFSERERAEIACERDFLEHFTAREAFTKMRGGSIFKDFKSMEYYGGNLYFCGVLQPVKIRTHFISYGVVSVCTGEEK